MIYQGNTQVASTTTGADGSFTVNVSAGTYKVGVFPLAGSRSLEQWYGGAPTSATATAVVVTSGPTTANVQLPDGKFVGGRVTETGGGANIAGASVTAYQGGGAACCTIVGNGSTDASGNYQFAIPAGIVRLSFSKTGYHTEWFQDVSSFFAAADVNASADVFGRDQALTRVFDVGGRVVSPLGAPIANAQLDLDFGPPAACCTSIDTLLTGTDGTFHFHVPSGTYRLHLIAPVGSTYLSEWYNNAADFASAWNVVVSGADMNLGDLDLATGFQIRGRVTNSLGAGVSGVTVFAWRTACCAIDATTTTDGLGNYALAVANGSSHKIEAVPPAPGTPIFYNNKGSLLTADVVTVNGADVTGINMVLP